MTRYKVSFTRDQIRHTPACALDSRIPMRAMETLIKKEADEVCSDGRLRWGTAYVRITNYGFEVDGEGTRITDLITTISKDWNIETF
ncbi:MAG: hypothetical protein NTV30_01555 [Chloroflexi bacterium]|nr:hypothetical protein [Chloroflexota bacterium]